MVTSKVLFLLFSFSVVIFGCSKSDKNPLTDNDSELVSISGKLTSAENGNSISNAIISLHEATDISGTTLKELVATDTTNESGTYSFSNLQIEKFYKFNISHEYFMAFDTTIKMVDAPAELNLKLQPLNRKTIRITTSDNSDTDFYVLTYTFIHKDSTDYPFFKFNERGTIVNDSTYHIRNITGQLRRIKNGKTFAIPYSSDLDTDNYLAVVFTNVYGVDKKYLSNQSYLAGYHFISLNNNSIEEIAIKRKDEALDNLNFLTTISSLEYYFTNFSTAPDKATQVNVKLTIVPISGKTNTYSIKTITNGFEEKLLTVSDVPNIYRINYSEAELNYEYDASTKQLTPERELGNNDFNFENYKYVLAPQSLENANRNALYYYGFNYENDVHNSKGNYQYSLFSTHYGRMYFGSHQNFNGIGSSGSSASLTLLKFNGEAPKLDLN